jgi:hypothetical protein
MVVVGSVLSEVVPPGGTVEVDVDGGLIVMSSFIVWIIGWYEIFSSVAVNPASPPMRGVLVPFWNV